MLHILPFGQKHSRTTSLTQCFICRYSIVAWGVAALFTLVVFIFDINLPPDDPYNPKVGRHQCFIETSVQGVFFHLPILILMVGNIFMFIITVYSIVKTKTNTKHVRMSTMSSKGTVVKKKERITQDTKDQLASYTY